MEKQYEEKLKAVLGKAMSKGKLGKRFSENQVRRIWEKEMGPTIQGYTKEIKLRGSSVYIYLTSAPLKADLEMGKPKLVKLFNDQLGSDLIKEVLLF
ncbi:MAG: DUF721 domain-containing protein [Saprospiraceae bacterium]|nr:DUF721 domain-containing protein [Saprospiraceae bacterium]